MSDHHGGVPLPPDVSRGHQMLAAIWTMDLIATVIVGLRLMAGFVMHKKLSLSDYLMLGALAFGLSNTACITISEYYGLGRHIMYLTPVEIVSALKYQTIAEPLGIMCPTLARISFAIYLMNLIGTSKAKRWILHACIWVSLVINLVALILILAQCQHIQSIYDQHYPGKCWSRDVQTISGYVQGAINSIVDLTLTVLPAWIVWQLQMTRNIKISLSILLGLSLFAAVASVVKTVELKSLGDDGDITYNLEPFVIWFTVENFTVISAASIPHLKPLFTKRKGNTTSPYYMVSKEGSHNVSGNGLKSGSRPSPSRPTPGTIRKETTVTQTVYIRGEDDDRTESELELRNYVV